MTQANIPLLTGPVNVATLGQTLYNLTLAINASGIGSAPIVPPPQPLRGSFLGSLNDFILSVNDVTAAGTVALLARPISPNNLRSIVNAIILQVNAFVSGGGAYTGPLDIVPGAIFGYSQRALAAAWVSDVITIREDNGDTTASFATTTNNAVDTAAVTTFLNGANGHITKLFDQSGNGIDLAQASTPAQPQWYDDGPNNTPYLGIAGMNAQGSLVSSNTMTLATGWTSFHVLNMPIPPVTHNPHILSFVGDDQAYIDAWIEQIGKLWGDFTGDQFANEAARLAASNNSMPVAEWVIVEYVVQTASFHILVNGVDIPLAAEVGDGVFGTLTNLITTLFFAYDSDAILNRAEDVAWGSALSAPDRLAIRQNIAAYRGITLP